MRPTTIGRIQLTLFACIVSLIISCTDEDEPSTTFHGTMTRESDNTPASGIKIIFKGLDVGAGVWPTVEEVSTHSVNVDNSGKFMITIPPNPRIDRFSLEAQTSTGESVSILSGCPDWACKNLAVGTTSELTLKVSF
jgi:hypothetical protein